MDIKVVIADDHPIVVEGLSALLNQQSEIQVVGKARNGRATVDLVKKVFPDVVVMDMNMPDLNGIEATRQILSILPKIRIIGLSVHSNSRVVREMLRAGAAGYLNKESAFEELVRAIHAVLSGQVFLGTGVSDVVVSDYVRVMSETPLPILTLLTDRERQVLKLLTDGRTTKQIAVRLGLSVKTVEAHRQQMMEKLKIHSIAELTKFALREGLTEL